MVGGTFELVDRLNEFPTVAVAAPLVTVYHTTVYPRCTLPQRQ